MLITQRSNAEDVYEEVETDPLDAYPESPHSFDGAAPDEKSVSQNVDVQELALQTMSSMNERLTSALESMVEHVKKIVECFRET